MSKPVDIQPLELFQDPRISWKHIAVYTYIARRAGSKRVMWFTQKRMAEEMGTNRANLGTTINELVATGWIKRGKYEGRNALFVPEEYPVFLKHIDKWTGEEEDESVYSLNQKGLTIKHEGLDSKTESVYSVNKSVYSLNKKVLNSKHRIEKEVVKKEERGIRESAPAAPRLSGNASLMADRLNECPTSQPIADVLLKFADAFKPLGAGFDVLLKQLTEADAPMLLAYLTEKSGTYSTYSLNAVLSWYTRDRDTGKIKPQPSAPKPTRTHSPLKPASTWDTPQ